ncbi:hypothetical protein SK128_016254, partial [Halocaridina rubra]
MTTTSTVSITHEFGDRNSKTNLTTELLARGDEALVTNLATELQTRIWRQNYWFEYDDMQVVIILATELQTRIWRQNFRLEYGDKPE